MPFFCGPAARRDRQATAAPKRFPRVVAPCWLSPEQALALIVVADARADRIDEGRHQ